MEPAKIDWTRIDSRFVEDCVYEHINAPKWVDFLAPDPHQPSIDDDAWFCTPDCNHPKTAEDFLQPSPPSKLPRRSVPGGGAGNFPFRELNQGDAKLKRRGQQTQSSSFSKFDDSENHNPNLSTPLPNHQAKSLKAAIKSSSEKNKPIITDGILQSQSDEIRPLKSSASARNLFAGRDILSHISEFCNELKKLASRAREREREENTQDEKTQVLGELDKERKPLLELGQEKHGIANEKEKMKINRNRTHGDEAENMTPSNISLNLEDVKHKNKGEERLLQIRTNPPSPQCFSAPTKTTVTPSKASRSRLMERGILQEVKQNKDMKTEKAGSSVSSCSSSVVNNVNVTDGRQARALDVFWFLKPCTMSE
ncbi:hypothetical protein E1A91_D08G180800v1 [Gossypium mustelinum]|uniref:Uncharacterized protein n=1 Tax=Gossypium mustelinum TaxID=34275 RepID=A0A5D2TZV4_GOSMU|nr:hypothetical protein E1A91_D08G180800v1 [Gossypium mustelinum]